MKRDLDRLFTELTPPQGGAERFAERLDAAAAGPAVSRRRVAALAAAAFGAVVLVAAIVLWRQPNESPPLVAVSAPAVDIYGAREFDRLLGRPAQPTELEVVVNAEVATVTEVATTNDKVRIYRVN
jgi:hypothetical protein